MADAPPKRSSTGRFIGIVVALIVAALLVWWLLDDDAADDPALETDLEIAGDIPADGGEPTGLPDQDTEITIETLLSDPGQFVGSDSFSANMDVPEVPTDRGFWAEQDPAASDARIFVLIGDRPREEPMDINPGDRLRLTDAMVRDADALDDLPGRPIDDETRAILEQQEIFLIVDEDNIERLIQAEGPGPELR